MNREQWIKIAKGFGIAMAGAALTFAATVLIPTLQEAESPTLLAIAAFASTAVNLARKWLESLSENDSGDFTPMLLAGLSLFLLPGVTHAQMVEYGGHMYSGRVCSNPRCTMCSIIESRQQAARAQVVSQPLWTAKPVAEDTKPIADSQQYTSETRTRTVTKYRQVCTFNRWGVKTGCQLVPYQTEETYSVHVPVASSKSTASTVPMAEDWGPTPEDAVPYLIGLLGMESQSRFIDIGAGDGRLVVAALEAGVRDAIGIEIDKDLADKAHRQAWPLGGKVYRGDALNTQLYSDRTHAALYQFPDMAADVVQLLEPGTVVVSYAHDVPGLDTERFSFGEFVFYRGTVPAPQPAAMKLPLLELSVTPELPTTPEPAPVKAPTLFGLSLKD